MKGPSRTNAELIKEISTLKQRIQELEQSESGCESRRIRQILQDSEVRYRRLFEAAQDGILIINAETGQIDDVNPLLMDMLNYSKEEIVGEKLWEIGPVKDIEKSKIAFAELQNKQYIRYENLQLETKDARLIDVEFVSNVYEVDHTKVIQCNIRDISARKKIESDLADHAVKLQERQHTGIKVLDQSSAGYYAQPYNPFWWGYAPPPQARNALPKDTAEFQFVLNSMTDQECKPRC